jgi:multicomponent Na+:H+ antiporter subunit E
VNAVFWNLLLALAWMLMTGSFTAPNFAVGVGVGMLVLFATQPVAGLPGYGRRGFQIIVLAAFTTWELLLANFRVARDIMRPTDKMLPGVIDMPLDAESDVEITLLAALITLTPGTTAIDVSDDRSVMYVHSTNVPRGDIEAACRDLKEGFERRILEVTR